MQAGVDIVTLDFALRLVDLEDTNLLLNCFPFALQLGDGLVAVNGRGAGEDGVVGQGGIHPHVQDDLV